MFFQNVHRLLPATLLLCCIACHSPEVNNLQKSIPSLDEISGQWVAADTVAMEPSLRNFRGQAVVNRDMTSISWFASAPYSGGYHTGALRIDGNVPLVTHFKWDAYQAVRKGKWKNIALTSYTRMLPDEDGILWRIELQNESRDQQALSIDLDAIGFISQYGGDWPWWYPFPKRDGMVTKRDEEVEVVRKAIGSGMAQEVMIEELVEGKPTGKMMSVRIPSDQDILNMSKYNAVQNGHTVMVSDTETKAVSGFAFVTNPDSLVAFNSGGRASWTLTLAPGETKTIEYILAYGDNAERVNKKLNIWKNSFAYTFEQVKTVWEKRWAQMFDPADSLLSGTFPVLETDDSLVRRVYYTGPLTMLYLMHTNLPAHKKVILTGGPKWGATISFFWDNTEWSTLQAMADPEMLKENIRTWIGIDPSKYYGVDNFGGKGVGNPYSANYWALFQLIRSYLVVTGDYAFLQEQINGKTVLQMLEHYATNGQRMATYGKAGATNAVYKLADFGSDEWNLLECVPTYKHIVPSFNAGYIWMMRETAALYKQTGKPEKADELNRQAQAMIPLLMQLYAGNGVWNSLHPHNKEVEVRHCLDFMFMGRYLAQDLSDTVKNEMIAFLYDELMTETWMRAQSLQDVAAKNSDRPDHGPLGAYDGWPAGTMDALVQMGHAQKALDFYRAVEPVTREGSWAQAHELWGDNKENKKAKARIAERGWHARDAMAGIGLSQVMAKGFFGFNPDVDGTMIRQPGNIDFSGKLYHVLYHGAYYTLICDQGTVRYEKESSTP